jgi:hypothetical protein
MVEVREMYVLEILARELHEWPKGAAVVPGVFTEQQWQAKRDELSGKPKEWKFPWARYRAQDANGSWFEFYTKPEIANQEWVEEDYDIPEGGGEVLGDWRDTLEERVVEDLEPKKWIYTGTDAVFKDPESCNGTGLPPVGMVCELKSGSLKEWYVGECVAHDGCLAVFKMCDDYPFSAVYAGFTADRIRLIRTDREIQVDKLSPIIDAAMKEMIAMHPDDLAGFIYDRGCRIVEE